MDSSEMPTLRIATPKDAPAISSLKSMHGRNGPEWLRRFGWQFVDNPAIDPERPIGWVLTTPTGEIVGQEMSMPARFRILKTERSVGISCDTFVDPRYRGQRLGEAIFRAYFDAQKGGLALGTSANAATDALWEKAGGFCIGDLGVAWEFAYRSTPAMRRVIQAEVRARALSAVLAGVAGAVRDVAMPPKIPGLGEGMRSQEVRPDDPRLDETWQACRDDYLITAVRDTAARQWRFARQPGPPVQLILVEYSEATGGRASAWVALRLTHRGRLTRVLELLDCFGPLGDARLQQAALAAAVVVGRNAGAHSLRVVGLHPEWRAHLPTLGFQPLPIGANPFVCRNMGGYDEAVLRDPFVWHLVPADGDAAVEP